MLQGTLICSKVESGVYECTQSLHVLRMIANMIETTEQYQVLLTNSKLYTTFTEVLPHVSTLSDEHQA